MESEQRRGTSVLSVVDLESDVELWEEDVDDDALGGGEQEKVHGATA